MAYSEKQELLLVLLANNTLKLFKRGDCWQQTFILSISSEKITSLAYLDRHKKILLGNSAGLVGFWNVLVGKIEWFTQIGRKRPVQKLMVWDHLQLILVSDCSGLDAILISDLKNFKKRLYDKQDKILDFDLHNDQHLILATQLQKVLIYN